MIIVGMPCHDCDKMKYKAVFFKGWHPHKHPTSRRYFQTMEETLQYIRKRTGDKNAALFEPYEVVE